jgi:nucleoside 2-deoxyribosyltransferase
MFSVYFAGELFSGKHLLGNAALANAIAGISEFKPSLPQNFEQRDANPQNIRDTDIVSLIESDLALFNFDGPEIDSGTVVEFMIAKFADIPALLLRTDFRLGGDQRGDPWNLMMSFYPRTRVLLISSMEIYQEQIHNGASTTDAAQKMIDYIAAKSVEEFRILAATEPTLKDPLVAPVYEWLSRFPSLLNSANIDRIRGALAEKKAKRLL